jgi:cytidylate kinase
MSRSIEQLVNQQVLKWLEQQRRVPDDPPPSRAEGQRPVICLSRQFGAHGTDLARAVGERLGFHVYDQDLVDEIAKQAHVRRKVVESLDERARSGIVRWVDELVEKRQFTASDYLRNLSEVVLTFARHGQGVIVGRGAHLILDPELTLRVRAYAPAAWRARQIAERRTISLAQAEVLTTRVDAERAAFYRETFNVDIEQPAQFDLLINASTTSLEAATEIVIDAFAAKLRRPSVAPKSGVRSALPFAEALGSTRTGSR